MSLSKEIIDMVKDASYILKLKTDSNVLGKAIDYYVIECPKVHVAVWPHWNIVSGAELTKKFYPFWNPAYRYLRSYRRDLEVISRYNDDLGKHEPIAVRRSGHVGDIVDITKG